MMRISLVAHKLNSEVIRDFSTLSMPGLLSQQAAGSSGVCYCAHDAASDAKFFQQLV